MNKVSVPVNYSNVLLLIAKSDGSFTSGDAPSPCGIDNIAVEIGEKGHVNVIVIDDRHFTFKI